MEVSIFTNGIKGQAVVWTWRPVWKWWRH